MNEMQIKLSDIKDVYAFNKITSQQEFNVDVRSLDRHYCLDAKSLMGLFSLDLSQPVIVITAVTDERATKYFESISQFAQSIWG